MEILSYVKSVLGGGRSNTIEVEAIKNLQKNNSLRKPHLHRHDEIRSPLLLLLSHNFLLILFSFFLLLWSLPAPAPDGREVISHARAQPEPEPRAAQSPRHAP